MKLYQVIAQLTKLADEGHADLEVMYRHGASGDCGPVGYPHVTNEVNECGPFDLTPGAQYISLYVGN